MFQQFLRGMETEACATTNPRGSLVSIVPQRYGNEERASKPKRSLKTFQQFLRGMETWKSAYLFSCTAEFQQFLRGMETYIQAKFCLHGLCFNSSLEVWKLLLSMTGQKPIDLFQQFLRGMETGGHLQKRAGSYPFQQFLRGMETVGASMDITEEPSFNSSLEVWKRGGYIESSKIKTGFNSSLEVWKPDWARLLNELWGGFNSSLEVWKQIDYFHFKISVSSFQQFLRGMETILRHDLIESNVQFQQFLRGMETM